MGTDDRGLLDLIDAVYAAALDPSLWPTTLERLATAFDGRQATLYRHDHGDRRSDVQAQFGVDPAFVRSYVEHFGQRNPFVAGVARLAVGACATADDLVDRAVYRGGEFFADWVRPQGCMEFVTTTLFRTPSAVGGVTVLRGDRAFDRAELRRWKALTPHLRRASELHREYRALRLGRDEALGALDRVGAGVVLAGSEADVLFANAAAERVIGAGRGIEVRGGRLRGETLAATELLTRTIRAAAATGAGRGTHAGGFIALPSRAGMPLPVLVGPLRPSDVGRAGSRPAALVMLGGARQLVAEGDELARTFGLTPSEARLLSALVDGRSLSDYAEGHGLAFETARGHLRQVLTKTRSHRQVDAVRRVLDDPVLARPKAPIP